MVLTLASAAGDFMKVLGGVGSWTAGEGGESRFKRELGIRGISEAITSRFPFIKSASLLLLVFINIRRINSENPAHIDTGFFLKLYRHTISNMSVRCNAVAETSQGGHLSVVWVAEAAQMGGRAAVRG